MSITKITADNKKEFFEAHKDSIIILAFDAEFTGQADIVNDAIKALTTDEDLKGKIFVGTVDAEENNDLASEHKILSLPMVVCILSGKAVKKVDTLEPEKLVGIIKEELTRHELISGGEETGETVDPKQKFKEYLKKLVNRAPVMVFMKGNPAVPRCGFSKQLVELLAQHKIIYSTFDILQDEDVRQGLKEYSEWPTYPQIYAKGEFVGGLDILKQLAESGELESTLKV